MAIYRDPETAQAVVTHSMLKTFRRCPKQAEFKYVLRLKPKRMGRPLRRGTWLHKLLELLHKGEDWEAEHQRLTVKFNDLIDVEQDDLGDLPAECLRIMRSYIWHYKDDPWKVLETEFTIEAELPDGTLFRCKIDMLVENQFGLWIVDHKSHKTLPRLDYRILDSQSADYVWVALKNKIPVQGHIWNYLRTKAPSVPKIAYAGTKRERLSTRAIDTDYPTYLRAIKALGLDPKEDPQHSKLKYFWSQRYRPGEMQTSTFFRRDVLEKSPAMLKRVMSEAYRTARRMNEYEFGNDAVERVVETGCTFSCSYTDVCAIQLWGGNIAPLMRQNYDVTDPLYYYNDDDGSQERKGED